MKIFWAITAIIAIYGGAINVVWIAGMVYEGARGAAIGVDSFVQVNQYSHPAVKSPRN
jgi:hypothetical protein